MNKLKEYSKINCHAVIFYIVLSKNVIFCDEKMVKFINAVLLIINRCFIILRTW